TKIPMQFSPRALLFPLGVVAALFSSCVTSYVVATNPVIPSPAKVAQLRPGDSVTVSLQGVPDPSTNPLQIDDQGFINLPYIGSIAAADTSPAELSTRIRETYVAKK